MAKIAYIFPGQGSQKPGMGEDFFEKSEAAKKVFLNADEALGFSISEMCFRGSEEDLALTENTQPSILAVSVAAYEAFREAGAPSPDFVAGHSLGEYSALVAAGGLTLEDAVRTVRKRGQFMQQAVPLGVGAMAAIIGLDGDSVGAVCNDIAGDEVCGAANLNSPKQTVIAGDKSAVERACVALKEAGARKTVMLNVSAPFHCSLMMPAQDLLENELKGIEFSELEFPIFENVSATSNVAAARIPEALTLQVSSAVRWEESVRNLISEGVDTFVEIGPGKVLSGLIRQIDRNVNFYNVYDSESLSNTLNNL